MKNLFKLASDLAVGEEGHHFGDLGGLVEVDHFFVEFLPLRGRDAEDVLTGLEEEAVHQESTGAFVAVPEASGASDKEKEGHARSKRLSICRLAVANFSKVARRSLPTGGK